MDRCDQQDKAEKQEEGQKDGACHQGPWLDAENLAHMTKTLKN